LRVRLPSSGPPSLPPSPWRRRKGRIICKRSEEERTARRAEG
jgi:hypothetical protein